VTSTGLSAVIDRPQARPGAEGLEAGRGGVSFLKLFENLGGVRVVGLEGFERAREFEVHLLHLEGSESVGDSLSEQRLPRRKIRKSAKLLVLDREDGRGECTMSRL
jgi:hypothetical protein